MDGMMLELFEVFLRDPLTRRQRDASLSTRDPGSHRAARGHDIFGNG